MANRWKPVRLNLEHLETRAVPALFTGFLADPGPPAGFVFDIKFTGAETGATVVLTQDASSAIKYHIVYDQDGAGPLGNVTTDGTVSGGEIGAAGTSGPFAGLPFLGVKVEGTATADTIDATGFTNYAVNLIGGCRQRHHRLE